MDGQLSPTALYIILALAITVTARVTDEDVLKGELLQQRPWLVVLLHFPVLMAWVHVGLFLADQLVVAKMPWDTREYIHLVLHMVVVGFVGLVCVCTYWSRIRHGRIDSARIEVSSQ